MRSNILVFSVILVVWSAVPVLRHNGRQSATDSAGGSRGRSNSPLCSIETPGTARPRMIRLIYFPAPTLLLPRRFLGINRMKAKDWVSILREILERKTADAIRR